MFMYSGIYKMEALDFTCTGVYTTKTPTDAYRGAGRPEATYAIERIVDEAAAELGIEPLEFRRKNWIKHEEFPYTQIAGLTYDTGNYEAATARALELFGYDELRAEQAARRAAGDTVQLGIGISTFTEMCGLAPSRTLGALKYAAGGWEHCTIRALPTGKIELVTGTSPHGQGHETAWSQIASDIIGVPVEDIEVVHGDTGRAPYGMDTYGSRSLAVGGQAIKVAGERLVEKARLIAAHQLEVSPDDIEFSAGTYSVKGDPEKATTIQAVAWGAFSGHNLPDGMEPTLSGESTVDPADFSYPHGTHFAAMEVDTETGMVRLRKYVAVDDCGIQINPMIVEGQVHGGLAQGIAQAMFEGALYDNDGNLLTGSMGDYLLPSAADLPSFITDRTVTPSTTHPLGTKGIGEAGAIASTPAIINGVVDAIRHLGVTDVFMPASPQNVWRAIQTAQDGGAA
jgi:carbon-monoxide dehydrogenase large subunit